MSTDTETTIVRGTGNVFADLRHPDADTHLLKAELVGRLQYVISERELIQSKPPAAWASASPTCHVCSKVSSGTFLSNA